MKFRNILSAEEKLSIYRTMKRIRLFERTVHRLITQNLAFGSIHFYTGEEAIAAGVCFCLKRKDYIISNHRCHGHIIAKGGDTGKMLAELMAREDGYCRGKGGTMHMVVPEIGMMGANGIVGSGLPIAVGLGYAARNFKKDRIVVAFFGDGAANTGAFHESLNLASVWGLPILFVCENNQYAISTDINKVTNIKDLSLRAKAYGIPGIRIDGNNVTSVINHTAQLKEHILARSTPALMVCETYRQMGHSINDPKTYRSKSEEDFWLAKDPVAKFENILFNENIINDLIISEIEEKLAREMDEAVEFASNSKKTGISELFTDVYAD
jgi:TPP-dependent pyruvate/acetoin dehydrogenase alpha subunit